jgi:hypothetical protein
VPGEQHRIFAAESLADRHSIKETGVQTFVGGLDEDKIGGTEAVERMRRAKVKLPNRSIMWTAHRSTRPHRTT